ncbi:MAG: outer membrane beta-barrel protein [Xanthobacteraceae bacterium]
MRCANKERGCRTAAPAIAPPHVTRDTKILLENRYIVSTDSPGSPNIQANLATLPINTTVGGTVGVEQQFSRWDATLKGTVDRTTYQTSHFADGESSSNDDRAYDQYAGIFRLAYEIDPGLKPFVEVSDDTRNYDSPVDFFGEDRSSNGASAKFGGEFKLANSSLVGEMAVGYLQRDYHDPTLPNVAGLTLDGSLLWLPPA